MTFSARSAPASSCVLRFPGPLTNAVRSPGPKHFDIPVRYRVSSGISSLKEAICCIASAAYASSSITGML